MIYRTEYLSPLGTLTLAGEEDHLKGLWLENQKYFGASVLDGARENPDLPAFQRTEKWLDRYFARERPSICELSLRPEGSEFRQSVWRALCEIPYGTTFSYGALARKLAEAGVRGGKSPQAVGGAVGHNPISIIIPCHRVLGADGSMTGYAGGISAKAWLLIHEGAIEGRR